VSFPASCVYAQVWLAYPDKQLLLFFCVFNDYLEYEDSHPLIITAKSYVFMSMLTKLFIWLPACLEGRLPGFD